MTLPAALLAGLRPAPLAALLLLAPLVIDQLDLTDPLTIARAEDDDDGGGDDDGGDGDGGDDGDDDDGGDDDEADDGDDDEDDDQDDENDVDADDDAEDDEGDEDAEEDDERADDDEEESDDETDDGDEEDDGEDDGDYEDDILDEEDEEALLGRWDDDDDESEDAGDDDEEDGDDGEEDDDDDDRAELSTGRDTPRAFTDELIAIDLDADQRAALAALGYAIIQVETLETLDIEILRIRIRGPLTPAAEIDFLQDRFPGATFDLHHLYRPTHGCLTTDCLFGGELTAFPRGLPSCGAGLRIGMVDAAVDDGSEALRGQRVERHDVVEEADAAFDHGTAVATLLVGAADGPAPGLLPAAELYAASVVRSSTTNASTTDGQTAVPAAAAIDLLAGLDWLVGAKVSVINISLAGDDNALVRRVVSRLAERGIGVVAAAGNNGPIEAPVFPAAYADVQGVTAVDRFMRIYRFANRGEHVDFAAPGVAVWTGVGPGGGEQTGTSFAAPFVAAILAVEMQALGVPGTEVVERLRAASLDLGAPGPDPVFGAGLIRGISPCGASG